MIDPRIILLPGMNGTDDLYQPLLRFIPARYQPRVITYPARELVAYDALLERIDAELAEESRPLVLIAESFAGPLAIGYAARHPGRVAAMVLSASFVRYPMPRIGWFLAKLLVRIPPPGWVLRWVFLGDAPQEILELVRRALKEVSARAMADRVEQISRVDVRDDLRLCRAPLLFLHGLEDRLVTMKRAKEIAEIRPDVVVISLKARHMLLQCVPEEAWRCIAEFLEMLSPEV